MSYCLIVDDSAVIRKVARHIIESLEFETDEAADGSIALKKCRENMPDAVLLDWNMPKMDGMAFIKALRQEENGKKPKVIFCTTENDAKHISQAITAGADEFVMKPFDKTILETKFQQVGLLD
ncbi:MAG: response regulator [Hyphomicrobiaceae bacterium]|nr:response regulator [Hyphomicrobiaceae bacterium]